ncbi:MAG TPA: phasin family protein, partial [Dongiaceae bacterium]|nr:phasin family protein [Dongiaceae bacterium]
IALQNDNVDALVRLHTILRDGAAEWSSDLLDFAGRNFQRQSNGANRQTNGANPPEALVSHCRRCQEFAEERLDQTAKVLKLAAKVSRDSRMHLENHAATAQPSWT